MTKPEWIETALARYERPLLRHARRITRDDELARDVVQDTFLRLCKQDPERLREGLPRWLFTVCRNRALDVAKRSGRTGSLAEGQFEALESDEPTPAQALEEQENRQDVKALLSALPERQQQVLRLKFQDELSYREIGEIAGVSVGNVGYLIHTALRRLRGRFDARADVVSLRRAR